MRKSLVLWFAVAGCVTVNVPIDTCCKQSSGCGCQQADSSPGAGNVPLVPKQMQRIAYEVMALSSSGSGELDPDLSGFLLGSPVGITTTADPHIRLNDAGFTPGWSGSMSVEFARFQDDWLDGHSTHSPILAMSMGVDVVYAQQFNLPKGAILDEGTLGEDMPVAWAGVGSHGWMAFQFTVDKDQVGPDLDAGDVAEDIAIADDAGELDASIFCYLVPGSEAVVVEPPEGDTVRAKGPADLGIPCHSQIQGLNMHMALFATDLGMYADKFTTRPLPDAPRIYFTLHPDFLTGPVAAALQESWGLAQVPDSSTIYTSLYSPGTSGPDKWWTRPEKFKTAAELGIDVERGTPVIDGLAIDIPPVDADPALDLHPEMLFSLAQRDDYDVPAEEQIKYVKLDEPAPKPVRVVVSTTTPNKYHSLGRHLHAGRGIGDFCTQDPIGELQKLTPDFVLDDFFVARRVPPPAYYGTYVLGVPHLSTAFRLPRLQHAQLDLLPRIEPRPVPRAITRHDWLPKLVTSQSLLLHPLYPEPILLPELRLAVSGYRWKINGAPCMRTCMSWPRPLAAAGVVTLSWGTTTDYLDPDSIVWVESHDMEYTGQPLVADRALPDGGVIAEGTTKGIAARWTLTAGGKTYTSPISLLRY